MNLQAGILLKSTAALDNTFFAGAIIFLTEFNSDGAVGYIINRLFGRSLNELEEFRHSRFFALYEGGPVDNEHLFFLHQRPDLISGGTPVTGCIHSGGNFQQALACINNGSLSTTDIKLFVGYCGWESGDLEAEIEEGSWTIVSGTAADVFADPVL